MAGSLIKKRLAFIFAAALTVCTASLAVGCQPAEDKPVLKSGVYVSNQIEGTDPSEYVFCVSRQAKNAEELLSAINGVIKSTDLPRPRDTLWIFHPGRTPACLYLRYMR